MAPSTASRSAVPKAVKNLVLTAIAIASSVLMLVPSNTASAQGDASSADPAQVASCSVAPDEEPFQAILEYRIVNDPAGLFEIRRNGHIYERSRPQPSQRGDGVYRQVVQINPETVNHFSISVDSAPFFYCGSVGRDLELPAPTVEQCRVRLLSADSAGLDVTDTGGGELRIRRNGWVIETLANPAHGFGVDALVPVVDGVNHFSVQAYNQRGTSDWVYCGQVEQGVGPVPPKIQSCTYLLESKPFALVDWFLPEFDGDVEFHVWRNGWVIDTFVDPGRIGGSQYSTEQVPGTSHISISTGRVGDAPDRDRRVYCGSVTV
jgi:hypothetical protein